ncbi:MAG: 2-hydroxyacid dehydrogenase [Rhodospirillales bacterium]
MNDTKRKLANILLTRKLPDAVEARAARDYRAQLNPKDKNYTAEDLAELSQGMDGLLIASTNKLTADAIAGLATSVRIMATFSVGIEHIDLKAATKRAIVVTNTPDVLTDATADLTMLLLLAAARRAWEGTAMVREGRWVGWSPIQLMGVHPGGKRLGILGMGRIGQAVARRARPFGMEIHYHNRKRLPKEQEQGAIFHATPEDLLKASDFLSFHCPLTPETKKFLNTERIKLMPKGAVVVNTARGGVIDDEALIAALKSRRLAAAGLDVFEGEPKLNPGYLKLENAFLTPHQGSGTVETRNAMGFRALDNLDAFFAGKAPPDRVA